MEFQNAPSADAHSRACRRGYDVSGGVRSGVGEALIEDTKIDRPRSWTATSRSRALDAQTEGKIHDISGRCEVFHTQLRPPRVLAPAHSGVGLVDAPDLGSRPAQGEGPCRA